MILRQAQDSTKAGQTILLTSLKTFTFAHLKKAEKST
jgi:hypothetical protein